MTESDELPSRIDDGEFIPLVDLRPETLQYRIDACFQAHPPIDPETVVLHNRTLLRIMDLPYPGPRVQHGYGHWANDIVRRPRLRRSDGKDWAYTPETCCIAGRGRGVWVDDSHLACPGCGVDFT